MATDLSKLFGGSYSTGNPALDAARRREKGSFMKPSKQTTGGSSQVGTDPIIQRLAENDPPQGGYDPSTIPVVPDDGTGDVPDNAYRYASVNPTRPDTSGLKNATRELGAAARRRAQAEREAAEEEENARRTQMGAGIGAEIARFMSGQNIQTNTNENIRNVQRAASQRRNAEANEEAVDAESRAQTDRRIAQIMRAADKSLRKQKDTEAQRRAAAHNQRLSDVQTENREEERTKERRAEQAAQREYQEGRAATEFGQQKELARLREKLRRETARQNAALESRGGGFTGEGRGQMNGMFMGRPLRSNVRQLRDIVDTAKENDAGMMSDGLTEAQLGEMRNKAESLVGVLGSLSDDADSKGYHDQFTNEDIDAITKAQGVLQEKGDTIEGVREAVGHLEDIPMVRRVGVQQEARQIAGNRNLSPQDQQAFAGSYAQKRMAGVSPKNARNATVDELNRSISSNADGEADTYDYNDFQLPNGQSGGSPQARKMTLEEVNKQQRDNGREEFTQSEYDRLDNSDFRNLGFVVTQ